MEQRAFVLLLAATTLLCGLNSPNSMAATYDILIRHGTIYDGSGGPPFVGDVAIRGDTIAALGKLDEASGRAEIDARGLAVAPGFINMLSWANESLLELSLIHISEPTR